MQEIKCPKCGEVFQIDEAGYAEIVKQVRTREFNDELQRQKNIMDSEKDFADIVCILYNVLQRYNQCLFLLKF